MRIIPAIDIIDGKCVRLTKGDFDSKTIYSDNPLDVAKNFEAHGIRYLHVVDLDGARSGAVKNWKTIEQIVRQTSLTVDFGGGIKTHDDINRLIQTGVKQVNLGSIAVKSPDKVYEWLHEFGTDAIVLSADVRNGIVAVSGWLESAALNINDFITPFYSKGLSFITCTDINTDGTLQGPNVELYKKMLMSFPKLKLVASGGVGSVNDLEALNTIGVDGVIVGKAFYEGKVSVEDLTRFN